ncbi:hypothetical protein LOTGIDRAFT_107883 [Lottia gigantea]|uniref:Sialin n=1 Tax=Lottia gigantea TaxID=225164 RepID=V3Z4M8_LOTGI|nr:hypothetical protein LOTGIDRAFT_107883 [Lottia gigantea]ESO85643.1 hypothetical protein LOTGIDRAFT_107883 [Lottia gigantea]
MLIAALFLVPWWTSQRFFLAIICFCGFASLYGQRVNLSIAIVSMVSNDLEKYQFVSHPGEFLWNKELQGLILGSFFWGYLLLQVPGGWLSEKFGAKKVIALGMFPVAVLSILTPVCARTNPYLLIVLRIILGIGEVVMYPAAQALWANWSPPNERSRLIGLSYAGGQFGNALIFPIGGFLSHYGFDGGWPSVFYVIGCLSFIWVVFWCIFVHDSPNECKRITAVEKRYIEASLHVNKNINKRDQKTPWKKIFTSKAVWAIIIGHVCGNYGIYMLLTQLPSYMKEVLKFDIKSNGLFSMLPYLCFWFMIIVSGNIADFMIRKKYFSVATTRKIFSALGTVCPGIFLIGTSFMECDQQIEAVVMVTLAVGMCGFHFSGFFINHSDIAPRFAGTLFGISNTAATIPGILAPYIVGALTKNGTREEWQTTFYIAAGVYFFGAVFYALTGEGEVQDWAMIPASEDTDVSELTTFKQTPSTLKGDDTQTLHNGVKSV